MKKILIGGLLLSGFLFANCSQAERYFSDSRDENNITNKTDLIKKAKKICDIPQIAIEIERLTINHLIEKNQFEGLELRLNNLIGLVDSEDDLPYEFRFNSKQQINKMFKMFYEKQKSMSSKKSIFGATIKNLDKKLDVIDKKINNLKSLEDIGGMYKSNLKFLKNSYVINFGEAKALKLKIEEIINSNPNALFSVTGYASSEGSSTYNKRLSEKRAKSFVTFVGKNSKNIKTFSKGEAFLVCNDGLIAEADENNEYRCINGEDREESRRIIVRRVR